MKIYSINFNTSIFKIEVDVHKIDYENFDDQYEKLLNLLGSDGLDVIDYNNDIAILVDDRGFEKSGYPIFEIKTEDNITFQLAGKLLFVRNIYNLESTDFGSITYEDIFYLRRLLNIKILGLVK